MPRNTKNIKTNFKERHFKRKDTKGIEKKSTYTKGQKINRKLMSLDKVKKETTITKT